MAKLSSTKDLIDRAISEASVELKNHSKQQENRCTIRHSELNEDCINEKWRQTVRES